MITYPDFVARVSGAPVRVLSLLRDQQLIAQQDALIDYEARLRQEREEISSILFRCISEDDGARRSYLIKLRRELFNLKAGIKLDANVSVGLAPENWRKLEDFAERLEGLHQLWTLNHGSFEAAEARVRQSIAPHLTGDFERAVALSSSSLSSLIERYRSIEGQRLNAKQMQIERGITRYLVRMAAKQTPFGTFCTVIPGTLNSDMGSHTKPWFQGSLQKRTTIRLNKGLLPILWDLLLKDESFRRIQTVLLNPTVVEEHGTHRFLSQTGPVDLIQRLQQSDALSAVIDRVRRADGERYDLLVSGLLQDEHIESSESDVRSYIDRLLEIGLLTFRQAVPEQSADWTTDLLSALEEQESSHSAKIALLLRELRQGCKAIATASLSERNRTLAAMRESIRQAIVDLGGNNVLPLGIICYEDATADAVAHIPSEHISLPIQALSQLLRKLSRIAWPLSEQAGMRCFFEATYPEPTAVVPLVQFYEDYFRLHMKQHLAFERLAGQGAKIEGGETAQPYDIENPFQAEFVRKRRLALNAIRQAIQNKVAATPEAEEVVLSADDIDGALHDLPEPPHTPSSFSVFCHLSTNAKGAQQIVAPAVRASSGHGKYFSRFLYLFPNRFTERLRSRRIAKDGEMLAEIEGDAHFNANLHPNLLPKSIVTAGSTKTRGASHIAPNDLVVRRSASNTSQLELVRGDTNELVWPIDLGFMNPKLRPGLHQLLLRFQPIAGVSLPMPPFGTIADSHRAESTADAPKNSGVRRWPRVVYEEAVVIARQLWTVSSDAHPVVKPGESMDAFSVRVEVWRRIYKIPERVYYRVLHSRTAGSDLAGQHSPLSRECVDGDSPSETRKLKRRDVRESRKARRDDRKPQYLDFRSPQLLRIFASAGGVRGAYTILIEEALPDCQDAVEHGDEAYLTEYMIQFDDVALAYDSSTDNGGSAV